MNTNHFDKNGKKVNIGDWVWFNDPTIGSPDLPKRGVIVEFLENDKVKLVNSDGYYTHNYSYRQTVFIEDLIAIDK